MALTLQITELKRLSRFAKAYKKLDAMIQKDVDEAIRDLLKNPLPSGRRLEKLRGLRNPDTYSVRINDSFRLTFHMEDSTAVLRNVGTHKIYQDEKNLRR